MKRTAGNPGGKPNPNAGRKSKREHTVELRFRRRSFVYSKERMSILSQTKGKRKDSHFRYDVITLG